ncbi:uncharacterized protein [Arachis hypogaea]|uniref:uncharacterized protein isoform X3 n=1 Tax=Arachis hypogaea TaxID=3818 RepID=UPI0010FC64CC|nr:uncharacterized protein LOC112796339 [Arachis hypogaea]XP_029153612.1 uncharacterized protein LOC112796339 [Arachis hypogaea]XP_029153613.1 uncharacterized protein LOC112796339 [Arachis hypogaea]XP_029153614.1 uncharacterized protein LOC112796339 [Arachis hypogaea]XP_029153615.1 uncharacterized protein LOC112796339 [Arachis hypogaea]XP_029153616.1 uncharacterized protein LOC112796339 [Arachis hypogaea]XP_029153617.1 uncharacterized protein LOC112796339 [Arachis hypogaea]XP_029153618.1 unc
MDSSGPLGFAGANEGNPRVRNKFIAPCYYMNNFSHQMVFLAQVSRILLITLQKLLTRILNMYSLPLILCLQLSLISHSYEGNRVMTGERDVKRYALPKANADSKMRFYETQGFRLKPLPGSSGINNSRGSSEPSTWGV